MRFMGLDLGSKTVGVAVSDPLCLFAQPLETIFREKENKLRKTLARIEELVQEFSVDTIILGLPLNMDDSVGERAKRSMEFKEMLERRLNIPVILQDERLSTFEADNILDEMNVRPDERKQYIDKIAASFILEDFMKQQVSSN